MAKKKPKLTKEQRKKLIAMRENDWKLTAKRSTYGYLAREKQKELSEYTAQQGMPNCLFVMIEKDSALRVESLYLDAELTEEEGKKIRARNNEIYSSFVIKSAKHYDQEK